MAVTNIYSKRNPAAPKPKRGVIARIAAAYGVLVGDAPEQAQAPKAWQGGYTGGMYRDAMVYWQPGVADADYSSVPNLRELRARSRDLVRNSPIAAGAIETAVTNVVGSGLTLQARIDADALGMDEDAADEWQCNTERLFRMWADSEYADAAGDLSFYELQDVAFRSSHESGDCFAVLPSVKRADWPFSLAVQLIEADRVSNENFKADSDQFVQGIEKDESGQKVAVWICNRHPGAAYSVKGFKWQRIAIRGQSGRRNVLHLARKLRPGQTRGIPALAPIIETLKQLTRYSTAEVDAAVNSAVNAVFVKMDPEAFEDLMTPEAQNAYIQNAQTWDGGVQSGRAVNLLPGEEVQSPTPGRPNPNFDPFVSAVMRQIGMALNVPHEVLTKHFQSSYSAARAALLDAWRTFRIRRDWLARRFCQPVYEEWLADAVASGLISAPGFFADPMVRRAWCGSNWAGDGPGALDPLKEAQAAEKRMQIGVTTLPEEIVAYDGGDYEQKLAVQKRVQDERVEAGLAAPITAMPGAPVPGHPGGAPGGSPDGGDDPADNQDEGGDAVTGLRRAQAARARARQGATEWQ